METRQELLNDMQLVNYREHRGHDGNGFNAELIYKGRKIIHVHDDAWGGEFQTSLIDYESKEDKTLWQDLLDRIKALPKRKSEYGEFDENFDCVVDDLIKEQQIKKDEKKGVLVKKPNGWAVVGFKTSIPATIKKWDDGLDAIQGIYNEQVKAGETILNKKYLESQGVKI